MLNQNKVLKYIKMHLGFPFQQLELEDTQIVEYFTEYTLNEFSFYIPDKHKLNLNFFNCDTKVPNVQNEYYLEEPDGLEILNVIDIYFNSGQYLITGHPPFGAEFSMGLEEWAFAVETSMMKNMFSSYNPTFEFRQPNIIRISPASSINSSCLVEYERIHPKDLRRIPADFHILFCDFALADIMIMLGRVRKKYADGNLRTPFGEIPLGADIFDEGTSKKQALIERLERLSLPNIVIDHG